MTARTSATDPIRVDWVDRWLGCTFAPGKRAASAAGDPWLRDLDLDLSRLRETHGVDLLISLVEDHELELLGIPGLVRAAHAHGIALIRSPIPDGGVPAHRVAADLVARALFARDRGQRVVFHCRGGLGRAGTLAACCLVGGGAHPDDAIARTRAARPGAIETPAQEAFVRAFPR